MKHKGICAALALIAFSLLAGCQTEPKNPEAKANLTDDVQNSLVKIKRQDSGMDQLLNKSAGYAVFPSIGKAAWIVGGAYGKGILYEKGTMTGYVDMSQASVGLQGGAEDYSELVVFDTPEALARLKDSKFEAGANLSAVALTTGAASAAKFQDGVAVFTQSNGGLMVEASVSGQKFRYSPTEMTTPAAP